MMAATAPGAGVRAADTYRASAVSAGFNHALALLGDGTIWSWGYNAQGQLGLGHTMDMSRPQKIGKSDNFVAVSAGLYHSLALASDGTLYAWGHNGQGQLGIGTATNANALTPQGMSVSVIENPTVIDPDPSTVPTPTEGVTELELDGGIVAISAGYYHSMVLTDQGSVYTWGDNSYGGTGLGAGAGYQARPQKAALPEAAKAIAGGYSSSAVIGVSGTVYTTGYNGYGDLGLGNLTNRNTFQAVTLPGPAAQISNDGYHMIALLENGDVYTWGKNDMGEVGNGASAHVSNPYNVAVPLDPGDHIVSVNAGYEHTSVLTAAGKLYCWGNQLNGRLGNGVTTGYQRSPIYIRDGVGSITDGGGYQYQMVILEDGSAWAAGRDQWGKMGNDRDLGPTDGSSGALGFVIVEFCR